MTITDIDKCHLSNITDCAKLKAQHQMLTQKAGKELAMITEIVTFKIKDDLQRADVLALYEKGAPVWKENQDLLHKSFLYDPEQRLGGGVYLWRSIDAARAAHGPSFHDRIQDVFGSTPEFRYFESPVIINNHSRTETELA